MTLNRAALIVRYKQPFVDWIKAADPSDSQTVFTLDEVNRQEHTVYLLEIEDDAELAGWLSVNAETLFEQELAGWYTDPELWPKDRSLTAFKQWCCFELHTVVVDTGRSRLKRRRF